MNHTLTFSKLNPDNTEFDAGDYSSNSGRLSSTLGWNKNLPTTPGKYIFEGTLKSKVCTKRSTISSDAFIKTLKNKRDLVKVIPNPNNGSFEILLPESSGKQEYFFSVFNGTGAIVYQNLLSQRSTMIELNATRGIYFYSLKNSNNMVSYRKLSIY